VDVVAISPSEVKLFVGQETTGFKAVDLQTATAEEARVDLEKAGKPIKVVGGMLVPADVPQEFAGEFPERGVVLCFQSKFGTLSVSVSQRGLHSNRPKQKKSTECSPRHQRSLGR
jgi:hypothetical protein